MTSATPGITRRLAGTGAPMSIRKVGVEEELMLVDPSTRHLTGVAGEAIRAHEQQDDAHVDQLAQMEPDPETGPAAETDSSEAAVEPELFLEQLESQTRPVTALESLAEELRRSRRALIASARSAGAEAVTVGAPVLVDDEARVTPQARYRRIREEYGELARGSLACAMHIHVDVADDTEGVRVLDGIGPWLPVLLAISANSPYYHGRDTAHASWRAQIWTRWPAHGTGEPFETPATYAEVSEKLIEWGAAMDPGMVYFGARLSRTAPTVEIRVTDVCTDLEDAVLLGSLSRALVTTAAGTDPVPWRSDLLRAAAWRASRYGIGGRLVDPATTGLASAREVIGSLVQHVRPALEEAGDLELTEQLVERLLSTGNGAIRQRRRFEHTGSLEAVVDDALERTVASCDTRI